MWRVIVALLVAMSGAAVTGQVPTFSTRTESVRLDVNVSEGGRIVRGLGPADFEVRDEGVLQQVDLVSFEQAPVSVLLALDTSHSVSGEPLEQLRAACHALLDLLRADDRAAVLTFDHDVSLPVQPTAGIPTVRAILDKIRAAPLGGPGGTALIDGTYAAMLMNETAVHRPLVIVFSDGVDTASWLTVERALDAARHLNVVVYGVTVRGAGDTSFLRSLAKLSGGDVLEAESTHQVRSVFVRILEEFRSRYLVSYSPRGVQKGGWHRVDVRVKGRRATVKARPGYMAARE